MASSLRTGVWPKLVAEAEGILFRRQHVLVPALQELIPIGELDHVVRLALQLAEELEIGIAIGQLLQVGGKVLHGVEIGRGIAGEAGARALRLWCARAVCA